MVCTTIAQLFCQSLINLRISLGALCLWDWENWYCEWYVLFCCMWTGPHNNVKIFHFWDSRLLNNTLSIFIGSGTKILILWKWGLWRQMREKIEAEFTQHNKQILWPDPETDPNPDISSLCNRDTIDSVGSSRIMVATLTLTLSLYLGLTLNL